MQWRQNGARLMNVPSVQIKNVPPEVHRVLRRRAAGAGKSLQEYLLAELTEQARRPTLSEVLERAGGRAGGSVPLTDAAEAVRTDRDER
jgi:hypothetical protein